MKIHLSPPLIVLMTDFGTSDPYVGIMKGVIETMAPQSRIIDLTHAIEPQNILQASFLLSACFRDFPEGTIFVCVVDPGVGTARLPVLAHAFHAFFIGPDNGLFGFLNEDPDRNILHLTQKRFFRPSISPTFHGRDIFAPVAAHLVLNGPGLLPHLGRRISHLQDIENRHPTITEHEIMGRIAHIDRFGTLITNIHRHHLTGLLKGDASSGIRLGHTTLPLTKTFGDIPAGEPGALIGSYGYLEIFVRDGSARNSLNLHIGDTIHVYPNHG